MFYKLFITYYSELLKSLLASLENEEEKCVLICPDMEAQPMEALLRMLCCKVIT
jgi:ribosomal protein L7Ae-like RNA K-turn-binding protein